MNEIMALLKKLEGPGLILAAFVIYLQFRLLGRLITVVVEFGKTLEKIYTLVKISALDVRGRGDGGSAE